MDLLEIEGEGTVASFTTLQMPPEGFEPPLMMALVELEYGAVVLCLAKDNDLSTLEIGDSVILSLDSEERFLFNLDS